MRSTLQHYFPSLRQTPRVTQKSEGRHLRARTTAWTKARARKITGTPKICVENAKRTQRASPKCPHNWRRHATPRKRGQIRSPAERGGRRPWTSNPKGPRKFGRRNTVKVPQALLHAPGQIGSVEYSAASGGSPFGSRAVLILISRFSMVRRSSRLGSSVWTSPHSGRPAHARARKRDK